LDYFPYSFHVALDGAGLNGLEGRAGMCVFKYDPHSDDYAYKIVFYDGVAGGHAVNVSPDRSTGFLGNTAQHLLFYDPATLNEFDRISTLQFEVPDSALHGSTHLVWLDDIQFITSIGAHLWRFDLNHLAKAENLGSHGLGLPHAMKRTASGRYVVYGAMDHPRRGEACEVGIFDTVSGRMRRLPLPTTCWHLVCHPTLDIFYALSFRVRPGDGHDWHEWGASYLREYAYEIDAAEGRVLRHWSGGREIPAHVNSDVTISDTELIFCTGGSHTVVLIDLQTLSRHRTIDEHPGIKGQLKMPRQMAATVADVLARGSFFTNAKLYATALQVSRGALVDGVYACQLSDDQKLLFTANRGCNHITVYDYPSLQMRLRVSMPDLQCFDKSLPTWSDPRLGFHHSYLVSHKTPGGGHD
jgi:hypothetical protein